MTRKEILEKTIDFDDAIHRIVRLEEENAKLKSECRRCVHTDCLCVPSDFGKNRIGICVNFKDVFEKNAELEEELEGFRLKLSELEDEYDGMEANANDIISETKESINTIIENSLGNNEKM